MADEIHSSNESDLYNEQISAYFDGEMAADEKARFESRLSRDKTLRSQLRILQENWSLLESLPREQASSRFTASTVEMVALRAPSTSMSRAMGWARKIPGWLWILLAALLSGITGYTAIRAVTIMSPVSQFLEDRNALLLEHAIFLEHFQEYQLTDNIDFLRGINEIDYFASRTKVASDPGILNHKRDLIDDKRRITGMNSGEKNRLHQNYISFLQLPQNERARLINFHNALVQSNDAEILAKILIVYARWYRQLDPLDQVEITLRPQSDKTAYIQKIISAGVQSGRVVTRNDLIIMQEWLDDVALRNEKKILRFVEKDKRDAILNLNQTDKSRQLIVLLRRYMKRDPVLLMNSLERKKYQAMASRLSDEWQQNLARLPTINQKIQLVLDATRRAQRERRTRDIRSPFDSTIN